MCSSCVRWGRAFGCCTNIVNTNACEFCTFHVKKAYNAMSSKRSSLQSSFSGGGDARGRIMSKIDPKGMFFFVKLYQFRFQKIR